MSFVHKIITSQLLKRFQQVANDREEASNYQEKWFQYLLKKGKETDYGRHHGLRDAITLEQFKERVPVVPYEKLYPYIERMMLGESHVLWPEKVKWFSKSSGTTNARSKFIPVTEENLELNHYKAGKDMIAIYLNQYPNSKVLHGKNIALGGSLQSVPVAKNERNKDIQAGDISAVIMKNLPFWAQWLRTPSLDIALMGEFEAKLEKIAQLCLRMDVTGISGVPTWNVVLLQRILELSGKSNVLEVWPNLEVFLHGAVAFGPYRELFKTLIPSDKMHYLELYNASEGFFGIQDWWGDTDQMLLLANHGIFYEFVPLSELDNPFPKTCTLPEVEIEKAYAICITTNGGLWRYLIGDTIKFINKDPYRFRIVGRTKHYINVFGEELMVENAERALEMVCRQTGAAVTEFTAAPIYLSTTSKGGHEWIVEFQRPPADPELFADLLDDALRKINSDYDAKRHRDMALQRLVMHPVPQGTFYHFMKYKGKLGGQHKVPRLLNSRELIEEILRMVS